MAFIEQMLINLNNSDENFNRIYGICKKHRNFEKVIEMLKKYLTENEAYNIARLAKWIFPNISPLYNSHINYGNITNIYQNDELLRTLKCGELLRSEYQKIIFCNLVDLLKKGIINIRMATFDGNQTESFTVGGFMVESIDKHHERKKVKIFKNDLYEKIYTICSKGVRMMRSRKGNTVERVAVRLAKYINDFDLASIIVKIGIKFLFHNRMQYDLKSRNIDILEIICNGSFDENDKCTTQIPNIKYIDFYSFQKIVFNEILSAFFRGSGYFLINSFEVDFRKELYEMELKKKKCVHK
jgi:hypothetical protein